MEIICPVCSNQKSVNLLKSKKYEIYKCRNCKLIYTSPLPSNDELTKFYQGFLFEQPQEKEIIKLTKYKTTEILKLFRINNKDLIKGKTFLDYGGGTGICYNAAKNLGFKCYYQDLDIESINFVKRKFGLNEENLISKIEDCPIHYDYIFCDNVIEHDKNPIDFVNKLYNKLEKNGHLLIKTPLAGNTETFFNPLISIKGYFMLALKENNFLKAFKSTFIHRYWHCDPPRHLYSFSKNSFEYIMEELKINKNQFNILYYNVPLWKYTLSRIFLKKKINTFKKLIFKLLIIPFIPLELLIVLLHYILLKIGLLTQGGIILSIMKDKSN